MEKGDNVVHRIVDTASTSDMEMLQQAYGNLDGYAFLSMVPQLRYAVPSGRPKAEPHIFDYDAFERHEIPSDKRLDMVFPGDPAGKTAYRDAITEARLLREYNSWTSQMQSAVRGDDKAWKFYGDLHDALMEHRNDAKRQLHGIENLITADKLAIWEFHHLDQDLGTKRIEVAMGEGDKVHFIFSDERVRGRLAWEKYKYLAPPGYKPDFVRYEEERAMLAFSC